MTALDPYDNDPPTNVAADAIKLITAYWNRNNWTYAEHGRGRAYDAVLALVAEDGMLTTLAETYDHQAFNEADHEYVATQASYCSTHDAVVVHAEVGGGHYPPDDGDCHWHQMFYKRRI